MPRHRNRQHRHWIALLATTASLIATAPGAQAEAPTQARYRCNGGLDASEVWALFFQGPPSEVVLLSGSNEASRLPQQRSGSGARYGDGNETFWIKGDQATWQRGKGRALQCQTQ